MKKHTTHFWLELFEIELIDPDGWRNISGRSVGVSLMEAISVETFALRVMESTILPRNSEKLKILTSIV